MEKTRPACNQPVSTEQGVSCCTACGYNLTWADRPGWVVRGVDLRTVARRQRQLPWFVLGARDGAAGGRGAGSQPVLTEQSVSCLSRVWNRGGGDGCRRLTRRLTVCPRPCTNGWPVSRGGWPPETGQRGLSS